MNGGSGKTTLLGGVTAASFTTSIPPPIPEPPVPETAVVWPPAPVFLCAGCSLLQVTAADKHAAASAINAIFETTPSRTLPGIAIGSISTRRWVEAAQIFGHAKSIQTQ